MLRIFAVHSSHWNKQQVELCYVPTSALYSYCDTTEQTLNCCSTTEQVKLTTLLNVWIYYELCAKICKLCGTLLSWVYVLCAQICKLCKPLCIMTSKHYDPVVCRYKGSASTDTCALSARYNKQLGVMNARISRVRYDVITGQWRHRVPVFSHVQNFIQFRQKLFPLQHVTAENQLHYSIFHVYAYEQRRQKCMHFDA